MFLLYFIFVVFQFDLLKHTLLFCCFLDLNNFINLTIRYHKKNLSSSSQIAYSTILILYNLSLQENFS